MGLIRSRKKAATGSIADLASAVKVALDAFCGAVVLGVLAARRAITLAAILIGPYGFGIAHGLHGDVDADKVGCDQVPRRGRYRPRYAGS